MNQYQQTLAKLQTEITQAKQAYDPLELSIQLYCKARRALASFVELVTWASDENKPTRNDAQTLLDTLSNATNACPSLEHRAAIREWQSLIQGFISGQSIDDLLNRELAALGIEA